MVWVFVAFVLWGHRVIAIHLVRVLPQSSLPMLPTRGMIASIWTMHHVLLRRLSIVILIHWSRIVVRV